MMKILFRSEKSKVYYFWAKEFADGKVLCVDSPLPARLIGKFYKAPPSINFTEICEKKKKWFYVNMDKYTVLYSKKW